MIDMGISLVIPFYRLPAYYDWGGNFPDFIWLSLLKRKGKQGGSSMIFSPQSLPETNFWESTDKPVVDFSSPYSEPQSPYFLNIFKAMETGFTNDFTQNNPTLISRDFGGETTEKLLNFFTLGLSQTPMTSGFTKNTPSLKSTDFQSETTEKLLDFFVPATLQTPITSGFTKNIPAIKGTYFQDEATEKPFNFFALATPQTPITSGLAKNIPALKSTDFQAEATEKPRDFYGYAISETGFTNGFTSDISLLKGADFGTKTSEKLLEIYNGTLMQTLIASGFTATEKIIRQIIGESANSEAAENPLEAFTLAALQNHLASGFEIPLTSLYSEETPQDNSAAAFLYTYLGENSVANIKDAASVSGNIFTAKKADIPEPSEPQITAEAATCPQLRQTADISAIIEGLSFALGEAAENSCEGVHI